MIRKHLPDLQKKLCSPFWPHSLKEGEGGEREERKEKRGKNALSHLSLSLSLSLFCRSRRATENHRSPFSCNFYASFCYRSSSMDGKVAQVCRARGTEERSREGRLVRSRRERHPPMKEKKPLTMVTPFAIPCCVSSEGSGTVLSRRDGTSMQISFVFFASAKRQRTELA